MAMNKFKFSMWLLGVLLLLIGCFSAYTWFSLSWSYSTGERAGYVQKFSHKGWLCKTWEGELAMVPVPGAVPEKFFFSVRDETIAKRINDSMAQRVSLAYEQHKWVPTRFFGETEYFVTGIKVQN